MLDQSHPLRFPIMTLRMAGMWSGEHERFVMPAACWVFMALLISIIIPIEVNMVMNPSVPAMVEGMAFAMLAGIGGLKAYVVAAHSREISLMQECLLQDFEEMESIVPEEADFFNQRALESAYSFCRMFSASQVQVWIVTGGIIGYNWFVRGMRTIPFQVPDLILNEDILYWPFVLMILTMQYGYVFGSGSYDTLYVTLCSQLAGKGHILEEMLRRLGQRHSYRKDKDQAEWDSDDAERSVKSAEFSVELERCVEYHKLYIRFHGMVEDFFSWSFIYVLIYFVLVLGTPALRLMRDKNAQASESMLQISVAVVTTFQLTFTCWFGDMVAESSERLKDAAMHAYRSGMARRDRNALLMVMVRTQRPLFISANRAAHFSVKLLMVILKRSYSLYSAAINLR